MAKHKNPTQVTIAPLAEKPAFAAFMEKWWKALTLGAVVIVSAILVMHYNQGKERSATHDSWNVLGAALEIDELDLGTKLPAPEQLQPVVEQTGQSPASPWAEAFLARSLLEAGRTSDAQAELAQIVERYPRHVLVDRAPLELGEGASSNGGLLAETQRRAQSLEEWIAGFPAIESAPSIPETSPRVRLVTSRGDITIGLYLDRAPKHVESFLNNCREGFYDGTLFHRVAKDRFIQGGDPNSRSGDPTTWGLGETDHTIPQELSDAWHFEGMVAAARKADETESSGCQFYITSAPMHQFDKQYTVFGRVLEGLDVVKQLSAEGPEQGDRPEDPGVIQSTEVL